MLKFFSETLFLNKMSSHMPTVTMKTANNDCR